jgi:TrmH family RNA methyltransferase
MITSAANQHVAALHALQTAKGREAAGWFVIEGSHLLEEALAAHVLPRLVLFDPEMLARTAGGRALLDRLEDMRASGVPVFDAAPTAIARASDTQTPQGLVAALEQREVAPDLVRSRRRGRARPLVLVLDALADPGNLGTLLRSALAADVDEVLLAPGCADPLAPKVVRAGSGAHLHLPVRADLTWEQIAERLAGAPPVRQVLLAEAGARRTYFACDLTQRSALLIGNEAHGPSAAAAQLATERITIPMWNHIDSLNAAIAASVILFEAARQRRVAEAATARAPSGPPNASRPDDEPTTQTTDT